MNAQEVTELICQLEDEVNNGGFHQFFYNNAGDNTEQVLAALETVGAAAMASIVRRAAAMFPGGMPPRDRFARQNILLQQYPYAAAFEELDAEFYQYPENLRGLVDTYVRRNDDRPAS